MKYIPVKYYQAENGFQYELFLDASKKEIVIWQKDFGFSFYIKNGIIDWKAYEENTSLLPEDVIKVANEHVKYYHLIAFA